MDQWEKKLAVSILGAAVLGAAVYSCEVKASPHSSLVIQSRAPWTINQCDRALGRKATWVVNISLGNVGGWPLWRTICSASPGRLVVASTLGTEYDGVGRL